MYGNILNINLHYNFDFEINLHFWPKTLLKFPSRYTHIFHFKITNLCHFVSCLIFDSDI